MKSEINLDDISDILIWAEYVKCMLETIDNDVFQYSGDDLPEAWEMKAAIDGAWRKNHIALDYINMILKTCATIEKRYVSERDGKTAKNE